MIGLITIPQSIRPIAVSYLAKKIPKIQKFREFSTNKEIHNKCPNFIQSYGEGTPKPCLFSSCNETFNCNFFFDAVAIFLKGSSI